MRELCRLQTFPDDLTIQGNQQAIQKQVGNAVPSLLAEVLAREIRVQLLGLSRLRGVPKLVPPNENIFQPPEKTGPVPLKYHRLAGEHAAHPGTGLGYGALARGA
jgi:DNA (cytosine-5)-methyltransferase 1